MRRIKEKYESFKAWQEKPYRIAPLSKEEHKCTACSTDYVGNFCPRCGQSSRVEERMTLRKTLLLFLDVWGIGNRGMFHTLRDLILRPGYLIADYLQGKRASYFPPFKLLFLLTTLSLIVGSGFNILHTDYTFNYHFNTAEILSDPTKTDLEGRYVVDRFFGLWNLTNELQMKYPALFRLFLMTLTCGFYFICFRNTRKIGKLNYHEFYIAMVYMVNMANIYTIVFRFFGAAAWLLTLPTFLYIIPLHQLSGYGWGKTVGRFVLSWLMIGIFFICLFFGVVLMLFLSYEL